MKKIGAIGNLGKRNGDVKYAPGRGIFLRAYARRTR